jgi:hypothetical protein
VVKKANPNLPFFLLIFFFIFVAFLVLPFISQLPFWQRQLPFWFLYFAFLALKRADWYDVRQVRSSSRQVRGRQVRSSRQVRGRQVREVLAGSSIQVEISINTDERGSRDGLYSAHAASPPLLFTPGVISFFKCWSNIQN